MTKIYSEKAVAYVELILILPVLLVLALGCIEFSNVVRSQQSLALLSREAGNRVFRLCADANDQAGLNSCLQETYTELYNTSTSIMQLRSQNPSQNLDLILGIYKYDNDCTTPPSCITRQASWPASGTINRAGLQATTSYSGSDFFSSGGSYNQLLNRSRVIVTGEVYLAYQPIIPFIGRMFLPANQTSGGRLLREVTLF